MGGDGSPQSRGPSAPEQGAEQAWSLETKSPITTGRYNPQGCGILDSCRIRCQASLKLSYMIGGVWGAAGKFGLTRRDERHIRAGVCGGGAPQTSETAAPIRMVVRTGPTPHAWASSVRSLNVLGPRESPRAPRRRQDRQGIGVGQARIARAIIGGALTNATPRD
jgi:hypothetical protein